jgi:hypothetical protein
LEKEFIIKNLKKDQFAPFNVTEEELISFALDESSLLDEETMINTVLAKDLVKSFYNKRENFRQNTRLGHILVKEYKISKEDLVKALVYHEENGTPLGEAFIRLNICNTEQIEEALKTQSLMRSYIR